MVEKENADHEARLVEVREAEVCIGFIVTTRTKLTIISGHYATVLQGPSRRSTAPGERL